MRKKQRYRSAWIVFLPLLFIRCDQPGDYKAPADPLFSTIPSSQSGLFFRNDVRDDSVFNEYSYRNFYNGGGVAIGDINNDGLPDIFLTANQGANKLFLNKGSFHFEDITASAGITKGQAWSTGVTMVDINGDGLLDIYVCASGNVSGDPRKNELYLNQGNLHFKEAAARYHLQDSGGMHTQAVFFDYDGDGDLDVFLLNNNALMSVNNYGIGSARGVPNASTGDKLLRNDHGVFTDVTRQAGIYGSDISFGLGVVVGDVNGDHWPDIYVSNDFFERDYLYINQRDGTFREMSDSLLGHMSQTSMGADMADINNDGLIDIFSTDMLPQNDYRLKKNTRFDSYDTYRNKYKAGYHYQLTSNMLHLNNGDRPFSEIGEYAGVDATDWSWGALIFDCNNDGWKDITVCNGMYLDVTDQDYIDYIANENSRFFLKQKINGVNYKQLQSIPKSAPLAGYEFVNSKDLTFRNEARELGLGKPGYANGAAYADLDADGDMDLVVNNLNSECSVYRNNTSEKYKKSYLRVRLKGAGMNSFAIGAKVEVFTGGMQQVLENFPGRGFQSCVEPILTFGMDTARRLDSLIVVWPDRTETRIRGIKTNQEITLKEGDGSRPTRGDGAVVAGSASFSDETGTALRGNSKHTENDFNDFNRERLLPHLLSREGPRIAVGDINGDGLADFFVGNAKHDTAKLFIQTVSGKFERLTTEKDLAADNNYETIGAAFLDADGDGDLDLMVVSGGNLENEGNKLLAPRLYLNDGKGRFASAVGRMPPISVNASCIAVCDYDGDGRPDVFIGGRNIPGEYGRAPRSYLLHNENGRFVDVTATAAPGLMQAGMVTDATWQDLEGTGRKDLIVVGEWMPITIFTNDGQRLRLSPLNSQLAFTSGWWNCIKAADLDNDGDIDFVVGNLGLNSKIRGDSLHPAQLYTGDFDGNGISESIITYYKNDGKSYPLAMKQDILAQMPSLKKRFLLYKDYAGKTIDELLEPESIRQATVKNAYEFKSCILRNDGHGHFHLEPLPVRAQFSPIYAILIDDIDGDGIPDLFLAGNQFGLKPELGRYDADHGTLLIGQKDHSYEFIAPGISGLFYQGEARDLCSLKTNDNRKTILLARNNDNLQLFKSRMTGHKKKTKGW